ncbi:inositol monophosphatase family protein [Buchnera aphidicola]|uniref:inositol monophosphatase family protein n=1 Tax=Buchnera aphidicola TaxID=9 RepID=UPI0031B730F1
MHPILNIAIRAIRKGGNFIAQNYDKNNIFGKSIETKKYLKNIQNISFNIISEVILKVYPNDLILKNTLYNNFKTEKKKKWIINTLDGKINFLHKIPHFCISIVIIENNVKKISVIYDPIKNDLFTAIKGKGAQLNGYRIRCSTHNIFLHSIIHIYFLNSKENFTKKNFFLFQKFFKKENYIRQTGCLSLDLAYLASGKFDFFVGFNIKLSNFIAGELQILESGALINNFFENSNDIFKKNILAGNNNFLRLILQKIF